MNWSNISKTGSTLVLKVTDRVPHWAMAFDCNSILLLLALGNGFYLFSWLLGFSLFAFNTLIFRRECSILAFYVTFSCVIFSLVNFLDIFSCHLYNCILCISFELQVPPTLRFVMDGEMPDYLLAKDLILQVSIFGFCAFVSIAHVILIWKTVFFICIQQQQ